jgi:hypothetical protein
LARMQRKENMLYVLDVNIAQRTSCLVARADTKARRWHACLGHVNMLELRRMTNQELVRGLPHIGAVDDLCEACMAGKQRRTPFPDQATWRAERALELVHGDLCGLITTTTPSGNSYFLLLVDDQSYFMWISTLVRKDQAAATIRDYQMRAKSESGCKLSVLRTDRGGEFTSKQFAAYCTAEGVQR